LWQAQSVFWEWQFKAAGSGDDIVNTVNMIDIDDMINMVDMVDR
jgi:hypothetical protein